MEVIINEQAYQYISDFPDGWKFSSGDPFKFPVKIGRHSCFIKLFRKSISKITGWDLMVRLRSKNNRNIPRIYDIKSSEINGAEVQYVFYEYLEGENLDQLVSRGDEIDLAALSEGVFGALKVIHSSGYWFADFCEKNIYRDLEGRFILLDLDSCIPLSVPPRTDSLGNKDYWSPVFHFYRDLLGYRSIKTEDLPGNFLNLLQLYLMVFRIHKFYGLPKDQRNYSGLLNKLHLMLFDTIPTSKGLFQEIFPTYDPTEYRYITQGIFSSYIGSVIHHENDKPVIRNADIQRPPVNETLMPEKTQFTDPKPQIVTSYDVISSDGAVDEPIAAKSTAAKSATTNSTADESAALKIEPTGQKIWDPVPAIIPAAVSATIPVRVTIPEIVPSTMPVTETENIDKVKREKIAAESEQVVQKKEEVEAILPLVAAMGLSTGEIGTVKVDSPIVNSLNSSQIKTESATQVLPQNPSPVKIKTTTGSNVWRMLLVSGITVIALSAGMLTYLKFQRNSHINHDQEVEKLKAIRLGQQQVTKIIPVAYSPDTLVLVAKQFEAINISVATAITSISDLSVLVAGKPIPPNLISLKPGSNSSLVTIFIDSAYHSGKIILNYPGLTIASNIMTIIKIKNRQPRHFHAPVLVNLDEEKRLHDAEISKRDDSLKRIKAPEKESVQRTYRATYQANYFEQNRDEGLIHKIFAKKQYLIHGHGFLNAKNGFDVFDLHDRLAVKIENDSILIVKSPRKVHALLLKLLPRGSADTLWVRAK